MSQCVAVIIKEGNKYWVGKRTNTESWASVGGHIENGETPKQAIIRECQEEFNTTILPKEIGVIEPDSNGNKVYLFYATDYSTEPRADKKEMSKVIWVTREELDHMNLYPPFKQFLELEKEWINNEKNDILVEDYNPATDREKYKWDPNLKKTVYIGNKGAVKKAPEPKKETKTEENKEEKNDQLTIDHLNERLKTLGFERINNIDKVDKKLLDINIKQLEDLESKFHILEKFKGLGFNVKTSKNNTIASVVFRTISLIHDVTLNLNSNFYKTEEDLYNTEKRSRKNNWFMPCNENKYLEYTITHEYGHLIHMTLADRELSQYSIFTIRQYTDVMKYIKNRIIDIVRDDNPELTDKDIEALQSKYSKKNEREFFAECFANSQCGKPNALGKAILKYLKNRGI